jgi:hypothetical protein
VNSSPASRASSGRRGPAELAVDHHPQAVGDHHQQLVAARMAKAVVDRLEPVEVDEQHRRLAARPPPRQQPSASARKLQPVGQAEVTGSYMPSAWALSIELRTSANRLSTAAATLGMTAHDRAPGW